MIFLNIHIYTYGKCIVKNIRISSLWNNMDWLKPTNEISLPKAWIGTKKQIGILFRDIFYKIKDKIHVYAISKYTLLYIPIVNLAISYCRHVFKKVYKGKINTL